MNIGIIKNTLLPSRLKGLFGLGCKPKTSNQKFVSLSRK
jgi:hypothetical protein